MTTGSENGTSGWARVVSRPWRLIVPVAAVVVLVNATTGILEVQRSELPFRWWEPVVWELTSAAIILVMAPAIGWAVRRWTPHLGNLVRPGLIHLALTVPFSLAHVAAIFVMRNLIYALLDARYGFFDDGVALVLLYEWRKDVLTYAAIAAIYWLFQYMAARLSPPAPVSDGRIEVRDGAGAVFLQPGDILFVEAAGNYVQFHTAARTHLVRGTLTAWEQQLTERGFVRVHRSRLVNRARIAAFKPTASGDLEIALDDGRAVAGSRRYRAALEHAG